MPRASTKPTAVPAPPEATGAAHEGVPTPSEAESQPVLNGVFVLIERDPQSNIASVQIVANGDVRPAECGDILRLAVAQRDRQLAG